MSTQPLSGVRVLDFSVQLPGPLATLFLAEAGAIVVKVERPGSGDLARGPDPEKESVEFALLNRGKRSVVLDLKESADLVVARRLACDADVLVEQFRPGAMDRLGLGYETFRKLNPKLIYCSISGYGQSGSLRDRAGHDLNYAALAGLLDIAAGSDGSPVLPPTQLADIGGGSYPAVLNILLALRQRDLTDEGCHLDINMADALFSWMRRPLAQVFQHKPVPARGAHPSGGGLARYNIYPTQDGRHLSVAAIEEKFWQRFCDLIGLPAELRGDSAAAEAKVACAKLVSSKPLADWLALFAGEDVCVEPVLTIEEAVAAARKRGSRAFEAQLQLSSGDKVPALPTPIHAGFRDVQARAYPELGAHSGEVSAIWSQA